MNDMIGIKKRLKVALKRDEQLVLWFYYPHLDRPIIKKGKVLCVNEDSFDFMDRYNGENTFSYDYLKTIEIWKEVSG